MKKLMVVDTIRTSRDIYVEHITGLPQTDNRGRYGRKKISSAPLVTVSAPSQTVDTVTNRDGTITNLRINKRTRSVAVTFPLEEQNLINDTDLIEFSDNDESSGPFHHPSGLNSFISQRVST